MNMLMYQEGGEHNATQKYKKLTKHKENTAYCITEIKNTV